MKPEQEAAEILIGLGFAEPEELEPEVAELLRKHREQILLFVYGCIGDYDLMAEDE